MKRVCGWCGKRLGLFGIKRPWRDKSTTHGICRKCSRKALSLQERDATLEEVKS